MIRANAFQECGWSPTWTLTEDFALGMELKKRRWQCRYMREYLAVGEAPEQVRNCFQQKSRWCKVTPRLCCICYTRVTKVRVLLLETRALAMWHSAAHHLLSYGFYFAARGGTP